MNMINELRLIRLSANDIADHTDAYVAFEELIARNESSYPNIRRWLRDKVLGGIRSAARIGFVGLIDGRPVASAVVKRGESAKFCHLRLVGSLRDRNLGELFFCLMAAEIRRQANEVHFTLPESLWSEKAEFFRGFGFATADAASTQYRIFDRELRCSAQFDRVWEAVLGKLPKLGDRFTVRGYSMNASLVISVAPRFAEKIVTGEKTVEIRRKFSRKWIGRRAVVYATSPQRHLMCDARIANVVAATPDEIWRSFSHAIGCTRGEFDAYVTRCEEIFALVPDDVAPFAEPLPLSQLEFLVGKPLKPPQSYCAVTADTAWSTAVSVAALLHGTMRHDAHRLFSDGTATASGGQTALF